MIKAYSYIRMSTDAQLQGDSLRRQTERTARFAKENGLILDDSLDLRDIGRSAYDGSNVEKGRLGEFLHAVRTGQVEKGSYLIVESLDRLSRQRPRHALRLFLDLLDNGINVATLVDRRVYTPDSSDQMDLMLSIALMVRAHDESLHKSDRLTAAWSNKRKNARHRIITSKCKGWLKPRADMTGFDVIPERAAIVKRIFLESADHGIGADVIARQLNREHVPTFGRSTGWYKSYILRILTDRAVLGEFQPHRVTKDGRKPAGELLVEYLPHVIDEDLFHRAQLALARRRIRGGGRKGARLSNLFSKIARCGNCGARMSFVHKGGRNGKSLVCDGARRGMGCQAVRWPYDDFERTFLTFIREVDLAGLASSASARSETSRVRSLLHELKEKHETASRQRDRVFDLILHAGESAYLADKLRQHDEAVQAITVEIATLAESLQRLECDESAFSTDIEALNVLIARLQTEESPEMYRVRSSVAARLASTVQDILVWPKGAATSENALRILEDNCTNGSREASKIREYVCEQDEAHRAFWVWFRDGTFRFVAPEKDAAKDLRAYAASKVPIVFASELQSRDFQAGSPGLLQRLHMPAEAKNRLVGR